MKIIDDNFLRSLVDDYIYLGIQNKYFDRFKGAQFRQILLNKNIKYDDNLPGDAFTDRNNTLIINRKRTYTNERNASYILFHEFTHYCNDIHNDRFGDYSPHLFEHFRDYMESHTDTTYQYGFAQTQAGDVHNPYTYALIGALLLDEVIAEFVAIDLVSKKYNQPVQARVETRKLGNNYIHYTTTLNYYEIGEKIAEEFTKTLFMKKSNKNLKGLCVDSFKDGFVRSLINQHCESKHSLECLYKELGYMGVIYFSEEQKNGHLSAGQKPISDLFVYNCYTELFELIRHGYENRETIPQTFDMPF